MGNQPVFYKRLFASLLLSLVLPCLGYGFEVDSMDLHLKVTGITKAQAPELWRDYIILTYQVPWNTRSVGAAFSPEDYRTIHSFKRNKEGVFFLVLPRPKKEWVDYRLVVDGVWQIDPQNPLQVWDPNGIPLSRVLLSREQSAPTLGTIINREKSSVTFRLRAKNGQSVYLTGEFNNWDPYMTPMQEESPGIYSVELQVSPGTYAYNYVVNGETIPDPWNYQQHLISTGELVSLLQVPN